jgi:hypothetical protein
VFCRRASFFRLIFSFSFLNTSERGQFFVLYYQYPESRSDPFLAATRASVYGSLGLSGVGAGFTVGSVEFEDVCFHSTQCGSVWGRLSNPS